MKQANTLKVFKKIHWSKPQPIITNTSWYTDTDEFLEYSPSGGSLCYKGPALQKIISFWSIPPHVNKLQNDYHIGTSITSHTYNFFHVMRTFKISSLSNFWISNSALLIIVIMLYITSPELITRILYILTSFTHCSSSYPQLCMCQPLICLLYLWIHCLNNQHIGDIIQHLSFSIWIISFSTMTSSSIYVLQVAECPSF